LGIHDKVRLQSSHKNIAAALKKDIKIFHYLSSDQIFWALYESRLGTSMGSICANGMSKSTGVGLSKFLGGQTKIWGGKRC